MHSTPISLGMMLDLMLFLLGFGFIVFIHELGHFLAARWAGIRVLAFAIGFGPAVCSFRRGLGVRQGSSEAEYQRLMQGGTTSDSVDPRNVSPTEYRLNWLPFGGYVKMLGQDDIRPGAVSSANDSYQSVKPWRRMVVISAGVVMNILLSIALFIVVFTAGLKTEPPVVGRVLPRTPAARAVAFNAKEANVAEKGLLPGDRILEIEGKAPDEFNTVILETTMAERGQAISMLVKREGVTEPLRFSVMPEVGLQSGLLEIGIEPPRSARILGGRTDAEREDILASLERNGLKGVKPGMTLIGTSSGRSISSFAEADRIVRQSDGNPVTFTFAMMDAGGHVSETVDTTVNPEPSMQVGFVKTARGVTPVDHLLGLTPVMMVENADPPDFERGAKAGLVSGDVFARIGAIEYPSVSSGMGEIKAYKGKSLPLTLLRADPTNGYRVVQITAHVSEEGTIGFLAGDSRGRSTVVAMPFPTMYTPPLGSPTSIAKEDWPGFTPPASAIITTPGVCIDMVGGRLVSNFAQIRQALREATEDAYLTGAQNTTVTLAIKMPGEEDRPGFDPSRAVEWTLSRESIDALHELGWDNPLPSGLFEPEEFVLRASGPTDAIGIGISRTREVMMNTYLTFVRLFQQTVKIEHLKGPVGIAHLGTIIAERGFVWMLFFLALISVNLAVVNFLPLPIVDGGQFLLLVYEQLRGKPAPLGFQNAITLAGFALIGTLFLLVTFNDVKNLLGM